MVFIWHNILFFGITTLITLTLTPIYAYFVGFDKVDWAIFWFMSAATMMATTFGYHRLFAHRAFKARTSVVLWNLFWGAAAFEQSALTWPSQHRDHHRFTDTDRDPYNIKRGFFYAHMGWFLFDTHTVDYDNVKDLQANKWCALQHKFWIWIAVFAGFGVPLAVGLLTGHFWGALFLGVAARFVFVHQCVFLINSACHMFGKATYKGTETARDSWVCALLTNGEGYHNYHHAFPNDYRNGVRWYHWDPTKWTIHLLSLFGMTYDLKRTPEIQIMQARVEQERTDLQLAFGAEAHPKMREALQNVTAQYERLRASLKHWEEAIVEYKKLKQAQATEGMHHAGEQLETARRNFFKAYKQWSESANQGSSLL